MKNQKGFSLIELLIVVVIIGIIAAIAIPNLLAARRSANEGSAISAMRTIHGGEMTYQATTGSGAYGSLIQLKNANVVDTQIGAGVKSGYNYKAVATAAGNPVGTPAQFFAAASPQVTSGVTQTGTRDFGIATEGVLVSSTTMNSLYAAGDQAAFSGTTSTALGN